MSFNESLQEKVQEIEGVLDSFLPKEEGWQKTVLEAMNYSVRAGGKRLRPMLMQETYKMFGGQSKDIEPFMAAIEMIHTYSLVHDDLPAMDNDEYRRGKKTTHAVFGEAMGILAGDGLLNYAFETALRCFENGEHPDRKAKALAVLANKAGIYGMIGGQTADIEAEDMQDKVAGILDGGSCGVGLESTVVDTTSPVPTICRPGGVTYEMLTEVLGAVEIDPALLGDKNFKPIAPGMKYRHYAPKEPVYLLEGAAVDCLPTLVSKALAAGLKVGVLCDSAMSETLPHDEHVLLSCWGASREALAADLFYLLRDFDRTRPDVILAQGVGEDGIGLAIMNRLRKAAGYQIITLENGVLKLKGDKQLPAFMIQ